MESLLVSKMLKRILNNKSATIASAAVILGAASLVSHLIGLFRDRILFGMFGAGIELDIYYAAFRIPDFVYAFFIMGVISAGFVPVFLHYFNKSEKDAWYLANNLLNIIFLTLSAICLILAIFIPFIIKLVAPGFSQIELDLTVKLSRIMFLSPIFLGMSAVFSGILQSCKRFLVYSLAPIMYNLGIIFGALVLVKYFGLMGLGYGVVLGALLHMLIQIPAAYLCGFRWRSGFDLKFEGLKRVLKLMPPRILSLMFYQVNFWVFTAFASLLTMGSIAIYNVSYNIFSFPLGIFALSFAVAAFPKLSESAQKKEKKEYIRTFSTTACQILFFIVPISFLFVVLRFQIVRVILGTGSFDWQDTIMTAQTLSFFCLGLFAEGLILLLLRGFFAWEDTFTPFCLAFFTAIVRISSGWFLSRRLGVSGLALGFALGSVFFAFMMFVFLRRKVGSLDIKYILSSGIKIGIAAIISATAIYFSLQYVFNFIQLTTLIGVLSQGLIAGIVGLLIYFFLAWLFRLRELKLFLYSISHRLPWKKVQRIETRVEE